MNGSFDWIAVLVVLIFWGWLLRQTLRGAPRNRLLKWLLVWAALLVGALMLWNIYVSLPSAK